MNKRYALMRLWDKGDADFLTISHDPEELRAELANLQKLYSVSDPLRAHFHYAVCEIKEIES